jgi:hypothetical protein
MKTIRDLPVAWMTNRGNRNRLVPSFSVGRKTGGTIQTMKAYFSARFMLQSNLAKGRPLSERKRRPMKHGYKMA